MVKCERCKGLIPCFCIEWSNLPDAKKCKCARPQYPPSPLEVMFRWLFKGSNL